LKTVTAIQVKCEREGVRK